MEVYVSSRERYCSRRTSISVESCWEVMVVVVIVGERRWWWW
jgi:hypothetical protein